MSNRHLARTIAMQSLFEWDFLGQPENGFEELVEYNRQEFAPEFEDGGFIVDLVNGVLKHLKYIDEQIVHFAANWTLASMNPVDRNILRLGVWELIYSESVPSKVAIDEAIELAKSFGGQASGRFVNGVLGAMYKDIVARGALKEADKEQLSENKTVEQTTITEQEKEETEAKVEVVTEIN